MANETPATEFLEELTKPGVIEKIIFSAEQPKAKPGSVLDEGMKRIIEKRVGMTPQEMWEYDFQRLTPEHDISKKYLHWVSGDVRMFLGRFYTAREIEDKRKLFRFLNIISILQYIY